jgi:hypothetical protein
VRCEQRAAACGDRGASAGDRHDQREFDRLDELIAARDRLTGVAPFGPHDDPIRDAESLLHHAQLLTRALSDVRLAALAASAHRRRSELAADVGTKATSLFPRAGRESTSRIDDDADPGPNVQAFAGSDALQEDAEPAAE